MNKAELFEKMLNEADINQEVYDLVEINFKSADDPKKVFDKAKKYYTDNNDVDMNDKFIKLMIHDIMQTYDDSAISEDLVVDAIKRYLKNTDSIQSHDEVKQSAMRKAKEEVFKSWRERKQQEANNNTKSQLIANTGINKIIKDFYFSHDFSNDPYIDSESDETPLEQRLNFDYSAFSETEAKFPNYESDENQKKQYYEFLINEYFVKEDTFITELLSIIREYIKSNKISFTDEDDLQNKACDILKSFLMADEDVANAYNDIEFAIDQFCQDINNYPEDEKKTGIRRLMLDKQTIKNNENAVKNGTLFDTVYKNDEFMQNLFKFVSNKLGYANSLSNDQKKHVQNAILRYIDRFTTFRADEVFDKFSEEIEKYEEIDKKIKNGELYFNEDDFTVKELMEKIVKDSGMIPFEKMSSEQREIVNKIKGILELYDRKEGYEIYLERIITAINNTNICFPDKKLDVGTVLSDLRVKNPDGTYSLRQANGHDSEYEIRPAYDPDTGDTVCEVMIKISSEKAKSKYKLPRHVKTKKPKRSTKTTGWYSVSMDDPDSYVGRRISNSNDAISPEEEKDLDRRFAFFNDDPELRSLTSEERQKYIEQLDHDFITFSQNGPSRTYDTQTAMSGKTGFEDKKWEARKKALANNDEDALKKTGIEEDPVMAKIKKEIDKYYRNHDFSSDINAKDPIGDLVKRLTSIRFYKSDKPVIVKKNKSDFENNGIVSLSDKDKEALDSVDADYDYTEVNGTEFRPPLKPAEAREYVLRYLKYDNAELYKKVVKQIRDQKQKDEEAKQAEEHAKQQQASSGSKQPSNTVVDFSDFELEESVDEDEMLAESINNIFNQSAIYDYIEECMNACEKLDRNACVNNLVKFFNITPEAANKQIDDFFNIY